MNWVYKQFGGRHTFFAFFFSVTGFALAYLGKLTAEYVALVGSIQALIAFHSAKEDYFQNKSNGNH